MTRCSHCGRPVDLEDSENWFDNETNKMWIFHRGRCLDEARRSSSEFGDRFRNLYSNKDREENK